MKFYLVPGFAAVLAMFSPGAIAADTPIADQPGVTEAVEETALDANVNSRYVVESVDIISPRHYRLSSSLVNEIDQLVGYRFDDQITKDYAQRISEEMRGYRVGFRLTRGSDPDHVRVSFEVQAPKAGFDVQFPKLVYTQREGASGEGDAIFDTGNNTFTFGLLRDSDSGLERASGIRARYDRWDVIKGRVNLSFEFDSYREQSDPATHQAAVQANDLAGLYRSLRTFEPAATIVLAGPLTWTVGMSFDQFQQDLPAARTESSNAVVNTLRYDRGWEDSGSGTHRFSAGYSLRAATNFLGGAYAYTRHLIDATYHWKRGRQQAQVTVQAGAITGQAPLFERFVLGTGTTLRGWDKFDIDPLGGTRVVYGSVGYGYRMLRVFYDAGAIWDSTSHATARQSAGVGIKVEGVLLAVAFPMRGATMEPVFIAGMNF